MRTIPEVDEDVAALRLRLAALEVRVPSSPHENAVICTDCRQPVSKDEAMLIPDGTSDGAMRWVCANRQTCAERGAREG